MIDWLKWAMCFFFFWYVPLKKFFFLLYLFFLCIVEPQDKNILVLYKVKSKNKSFQVFCL